jgi:hypothetical protein
LEDVTSKLEAMAGIGPITAMTAIIKATTATITGMVADTTETVIGEDGMIGIDHTSINYRAHPGGPGKSKWGRPIYLKGQIGLKGFIRLFSAWLR